MGNEIREMHHKLVRDEVPRLIMEDGEEPFFHQANSIEYEDKLKEKLQEEVDEFLEDETIEELADIYEVLRALAEFCGSDIDKVVWFAEEKREMKGAFKEKYILEEVKK